MLDGVVALSGPVAATAGGEAGKWTEMNAAEPNGCDRGRSLHRGTVKTILLAWPCFMETIKSNKGLWLIRTDGLISNNRNERF